MKIVRSLMIPKLKTKINFMMNIIFLILINIEMIFLLLKRNLKIIKIVIILLLKKMKVATAKENQLKIKTPIYINTLIVK